MLPSAADAASDKSNDTVSRSSCLAWSMECMVLVWKLSSVDELSEDERPKP